MSTTAKMIHRDVPFLCMTLFFLFFSYNLNSSVENLTHSKYKLSDTNAFFLGKVINNRP